MLGVLHAVKFLFMAPFLLGLLTLINLMTTPGVCWVQWAALGLGIAWFINLFKVLRAVVLMGGLAALGYWLWKRYGNGGVPPPRIDPSHDDNRHGENSCDSSFMANRLSAKRCSKRCSSAARTSVRCTARPIRTGGPPIR